MLGASLGLGYSDKEPAQASTIEDRQIVENINNTLLHPVPTPDRQAEYEAMLTRLHEVQQEEARKAEEARLAAIKAEQERIERERAEAAVRAQEEARAITARASISYGNTYAWGNCTWYVASRRSVPPMWGNANAWAASARAAGWTVSSSPVVGAVAQTSAGVFGHVAYVEAVGAGTVTVSEMNVQGLNVVSSRTVSASEFVYLY